MVSLPYPITLPALTDSQVTHVGVKSPKDVVVVSALRTALTRGKKGGFKDVLADELLMNVFKATIERTGIDPALVQDITVGNVCAEGNLATPSRMAALAAGFPEATAVSTLHRQCSSGLQACVQVASAIQCGALWQKYPMKIYKNFFTSIPPDHTTIHYTTCSCTYLITLYAFVPGNSNTQCAVYPSIAHRLLTILQTTTNTVPSAPHLRCIYLSLETVTCSK